MFFTAVGAKEIASVHMLQPLPDLQTASGVCIQSVDYLSLLRSPHPDRMSEY